MAVYIEAQQPGGTVRHQALNITTAVLHTATGILSLTMKNQPNGTQVITVPGQDGTDLYNALVALTSVSCSTTT